MSAATKPVTPTAKKTPSKVKAVKPPQPAKPIKPSRKPMKAKSKSTKGSKFEREICSQLSIWWSAGKQDDIFYRTPGSGARATSRAKADKTTHNQYGDISASSPQGEELLKLLRFELKRGYSTNTIQDLLDGKKESNYAKWIEHAKTCATQAGSKSWMLVHRRDARNTVAILPTDVFDRLTINSKTTPPHWTSYRSADGTSISCVLLDELLACVDPKHVSSLL